MECAVDDCDPSGVARAGAAALRGRSPFGTAGRMQLECRNFKGKQVLRVLRENRADQNRPETSDIPHVGLGSVYPGFPFWFPGHHRLYIRDRLSGISRPRQPADRHRPSRCHSVPAPNGTAASQLVASCDEIRSILEPVFRWPDAGALVIDWETVSPGRGRPIGISSIAHPVHCRFQRHSSFRRSRTHGCLTKACLGSPGR